MHKSDSDVAGSASVAAANYYGVCVPDPAIAASIVLVEIGGIFIGHCPDWDSEGVTVFKSLDC